MPADSQRETLQEPGLASPSQPESMVGRVFKGLYRIESLLGKGAMGIVFRGTQLGLGKTVAIKMIRADILVNRDSHDRFQREAQVLSKLLHPGIAQVLDFGIEDGTPFLVMEFVDGKELTEVMTLEGPMAPSRAIAIVRQLAAALEEAHRLGIVHREATLPASGLRHVVCAVALARSAHRALDGAWHSWSLCHPPQSRLHHSPDRAF
jgi:serine/threonine protein kinase